MTAACHFEQRYISFRKQDGSQSTHSRSTSLGSSSGSNPDEAYLQDKSLGSLSQLPDYDYPAPVFVRNTFLNTPIVRPLSLDDFIEERRIQSCPVEAPDGDAREEAEALRPNFHIAATLFSDVANEASRAVSSFYTWWNPVDSNAISAASSAQVPSQGASQIICLANALQEPELGSSELPTIGSAEHKWGTCKPCAFLYKRGCENGVHCAFCHLCDAGAKKRRQKEKIALLREMRGLAMS